MEEDLAVGTSGDCMRRTSSPARRFSKTSSTSSEASLFSPEVSLLLKSSAHDFDALTLLPSDVFGPIPDFSVTELLEVTGNAMFWVKSFALFSKAMMSMVGYLSLNQCRKIDDCGTNVDCLAHKLLNWVMVLQGGSSSSGEEESASQPNLGGIGFLASANFTEAPSCIDL